MGAVGRNLDGTAFYIDTLLVLRALGLAEEHVRIATEELLNLIRTHCGRVMVFEHTIDEVERVLSFASDRLRQGELHAFPGETYTYLYENGYSNSDIELLQSNSQRRIESRAIGVVNVPESAAEATVEERALGEFFQKRIRYRNPEARVHDTSSIVGINHLRRGMVPRQLEDSTAVFVTPNSAMVSASAAFIRREYSELQRRETIPLVILDWVATTLLWLKNPAQNPDIPRHRLVADSFAVMTPSDPLWGAYVEEVERLHADGQIAEDDQYAFRTALTVRRELMAETLGDQEAMSPAVALEIVNNVRSRIRDEVRGEVEQDLAAERERVMSEVRESALRQARSEVSSVLRATAGREAQLNERLGEVHGYEQGTDERIAAIASKVGRALAGAVFLAVAAAVIIVALPFNDRLPFPWVWTMLLICVAVIAVANALVGTTVRDIAKWLDRKVSSGVEQGIRRLLAR